MAVLISHEVSKFIMQNARPQYIAMSSFTFEIEYPSDRAIQKELKDNPLLRQKMVDAANADYRLFSTVMVDRCKKWDREVGKSVRDKKKVDEILLEANRDFDDAYFRYSTIAENSVSKCWTDYQKKHVEYKNYRWKTRTKLGIAIISLVAGIASMAASVVSAGASIIVSVAGTLKSAVTLYNRIRDITKSMERIQTDLIKVIRTVERRYEEGMRGHMKNAGDQFLNHFIATERKTFAEAQRLLDLLLGKIADVDAHANRASRLLDKALRQSDTLNKRENGDLQPRELNKVEALERKIMVLLYDTQQSAKRTSDADSYYRRMAHDMQNLKRARPMSIRAFEQALEISEFAFSTEWTDVAMTAADIAASYTAEKIIDRVYR